MSIVSTGIGTDNVEIVIAEILAITKRPTLIRVGSCGALQPEMAPGNLATSTGAVRLETTTSWFVHDGYPAVADYEVVLALLEAVSDSAPMDAARRHLEQIRAYLQAGKKVYCLNPHEAEVEGQPCYRSLAELPGGWISDEDAVRLYVDALSRTVEVTT